MAIFRCNCGFTKELDDSLIGRKARCKQCGEAAVVIASESAEEFETSAFEFNSEGDSQARSSRAEDHDSVGSNPPSRMDSRLQAEAVTPEPQHSEQSTPIAAKLSPTERRELEYQSIEAFFFGMTYLNVAVTVILLMFLLITDIETQMKTWIAGSAIAETFVAVVFASCVTKFFRALMDLANNSDRIAEMMGSLCERNSLETSLKS